MFRAEAPCLSPVGTLDAATTNVPARGFAAPGIRPRKVTL